VEAAVTTLPEPAPAAPEPATAPIPEPTAAPEPAPNTAAAIPQGAAPAAPAAPVSEPQQQGLAALFPPEPQPRARTGVVGLKLLVLAGQDAINNIKQRTARDPVVQVVDENDRPVAGAAITFALPSRGASGVFANGARSMTILTDAQGTAAASGLTPNAVAGELPIQVSASYQGQTASAVITQTNAVAAGAGMSAATIGIIGAVVAGAAEIRPLLLPPGPMAPQRFVPAG
jgi:DNA polymerase-3 subunit gamma/tau